MSHQTIGANASRIKARGGAAIEDATLYFAGADCGQGNHTIIAQFAAEVLSLPVGRVKVIASDTSLMANAGGASASRLTYMSGNAVAARPRRRLPHGNENARGGRVHLSGAQDHQTRPGDRPGPAQLRLRLRSPGGVLAVDTETGQVKVERFISADDVGQAIDPQQVTGQIEGAAVQALGYAVLEDWKSGRPRAHRQVQHLHDPHRAGRARSDRCRSSRCPIPTAPFGARGMGSALSAGRGRGLRSGLRQTGVRFDEFPLTPEHAWHGLQAKK